MTTFLGKENNAISAVADVAGIDGSTNPVTFNVTTGEGSLFPASNFVITIDNEILLCTSRTGDALTCTRAQEGTTIASHTQNADVELRITAGTLEEYETLSKMQGMEYAADAGSTDTYAVTLAPAPTAYFTGMTVKFKANTLNTGAATLNVNSLGAKTIKKNYNTDLETGDILANQLVSVIYDGTNFQMLSPSAALSVVSTDGWITISDTLTYASATSFTIAGVDRTSTYTKGTRIKLTQTSAKYFVVTSSSFSTDTTVNVTGGSDYTVANAAITSPYYSYQMNPQGYPDWFTYTPTAANFTVGDGSWTRSKFRVTGKRVDVSIKFTFGSTSAMSTSMSITSPTTISSVYTGTIDSLGVGWVRDAGNALYYGNWFFLTTTTLRIEVVATGSTYATATGLSSTVPMTWGANDEFGGELSYEL